MAQPLDVDLSTPPFNRFKSLQRLAPDRSGHRSEHTRHRLYVGRDRKTAADLLVKLTSKPGLVYQADLANEIASLLTIHRELPHSRYFPEIHDHGQLADGRTYLITSLFAEFPLLASIGPERLPARLVGHLRTAIEITKALSELHGVGIIHVDLNPMNILYRSEKGRPIIRIVDFESSYEIARHSTGVFYSPPTTTGYSAPEISQQAPDARADVFSLGAVLYTMVAGYQWTQDTDVQTSVSADPDLDPELKALLCTALEPQPARRFASSEACGAAMTAYLDRIWPGRSW